MHKNLKSKQILNKIKNIHIDNNESIHSINKGGYYETNSNLS